MNPERDALVIKLRAEGWSYVSIARTLGISRSRAAQIVGSHQRRLQAQDELPKWMKNLSVRAANVWLNSGLTEEHISDMTNDEIRRVLMCQPNCGWLTAGELLTALQSRSLAA